jgi:hypothetical protein
MHSTSKYVALGVGIVLAIVGLALIADPFAAGQFAKAYFAAGDFAMGVFASGMFSIGIFSAGIFSVGIFSIGVFSFGLFSKPVLDGSRPKGVPLETSWWHHQPTRTETGRCRPWLGQQLVFALFVWQ